MIITDRFVFIHMPKTGGTFVSEVLKQLHESFTPSRIDRLLRRGARSSFRSIDIHGTCNAIPEADREKPVLSVIRSPYDRHVSRYEAGHWRKRLSDLEWESRARPDHRRWYAPDYGAARRRYPHSPDLSFAEYIEVCTGMLAPLGRAENGSGIAVGQLTRQVVRYYFRNPTEVLSRIDDDYVASGAYRADMYPVHFMHTDRLNDDLHAYLLGIGYPPSAVAFVRSVPKIFPLEGGRTEEQAWPTYYTPELKRLVRERERLLFAMFPEFDT